MDENNIVNSNAEGQEPTAVAEQPQPEAAATTNAPADI